MKVKAKRKNRGYKAYDKPYLKALKRADKTKVPLATLIEKVVDAYSDGCNIIAGSGEYTTFLNADADTI
jgi:hypothetical protein